MNMLSHHKKLIFFNEYIKDKEKLIKNSFFVNYDIIYINNKAITISIINKYDKRNNYINSLTKFYTDPVRDDYSRVCNNLFLKLIIILFCYLVKLFLILIKLDHAVHVNTLTLDTSTEDDINSLELEELKKILCKKYPFHYIVFRGVFFNRDKVLFGLLQSKNYNYFVSHDNYVANFDEDIKHRFRYKIKKDKINVELNNLKYCDLDKYKNNNEDIFSKMEILYKNIYLEKYTKFSPQYTKYWFENAAKSGFLRFKIVYNSEGLKGFSSFFEDGKYMLSMCLGHDKTPGVYQACWLAIIEEAMRNKKKLFMGSGVKQFKTSRGGDKYHIYDLIYSDHLNFFRKISIKIISKCMIKIQFYGKKHFDKLSMMP